MWCVCGVYMLSMCVYVCVCVGCLYVYTCESIGVCMHMHTYICVHIYMCVCVCVRACVCVSDRVCECTSECKCWANVGPMSKIMLYVANVGSM